MPVNSESSPPPVIGKIGHYTVFMTPPSTPNTNTNTNANSSSSEAPLHSPPKVVPPPPQIADADGSVVLGFLKNAFTKVQTAHSSLDDHLARWFGLNQSKYQWALDDYYESKGMEKGDIKVKEISSKVQSV